MSNVRGKHQLNSIATGKRRRKPQAQADPISTFDTARIYDEMPGMVVVMDTDHTILDLNKPAAAAAGKVKKECIGLKFWDLFDNPGCRAGTCPASQAVKTGKLCEGEALPIVQGKEVPVLVCANPLFDETGRVTRIVELIFPAAGEVHLAHGISDVANAAAQGNLGGRLDLSRFQDRHLDRAKGVNAMLDAVTHKVMEAAANTKAVREVMQAVDAVASVDEAVQSALDAVRTAFEWSYGSYWSLDEKTQSMACTAESGSLPQEFRRVLMGLHVREGEGMLGNAWKNRDMHFVQHLATLKGSSWAELASRLGVKSGLALPITNEGAVVGVMDFFSVSAMDPSSDRLEAVRGVGQLLSSSIARIAAGENERKAQKALADGMQAIRQTGESLASAAENLKLSSQQMSSNAEETSAQANTVASATRQVTSNLNGVATGAEEMTSTVQSISSNAAEAAKIASEAVKTANSANTTVAKLGESSAEIGQVIKVITSIAQQTNLLALNATIEAARAGEAGKGFAVVANEVKELAKQTAKATEDISQKITAIQEDTKRAVESIGSITAIINQINDISGTIATAVEEQSATTNEMSRNVQEAAKGSGEISQNIQGVATAAESTTHGAQDTLKAAQQLTEMATQLRTLVEQFKLSDSEPSQASATSKARAAHGTS